jgi:tellurite resistance protein
MDMNLSNPARAAAENTPDQQRGRPFQPGVSGNPNGRPKGARNKTTLAVEALLDGEAEAITRTLLEKAKAGDLTASRLVFERLLPLRRDRPVAFELPAIASAADALAASQAVLAACADGDLSPSEAAQVMELIKTHVRIFESVELEARLSALEQESNEPKEGSR